MRILLRRMFPCPPVARWRRFEDLLKTCLQGMGHTVEELDLDPSFPADPPGFDFRIYAHKTRRETNAADLFYKEMHMQGLFTVDREGWGADHSASISPPGLEGISAAQAAAFCQALRQQFLSSGHSKHVQPPMRQVPGHVKPYVLVPLQLPTDDVIMYHSPFSVVRFIDMLADWAESCGQKLVFKLHPGHRTPEIEDAMARRASAAGPVFLLDENIHSLIVQSEGVMAINSGVGFEALIHGWPVVTFGAADYQWATFRAGAGDPGAGLQNIRAFSEEQRILGYRFIYFYYHRHAYDTRSADPENVSRRLLSYLTRTVTSCLGAGR